MVKYNVRSNLVILAAVVLFASVSAPVYAFNDSFKNFVKSKKGAACVATVIGAWIRLKTKPNSVAKHYKFTPMEDLQKLVALLKADISVFKALPLELIALIDKWVIGRKFSLIDTELDTKQENGSILKEKDKAIKSLPFGFIGVIDAYGVQQLEWIVKVCDSIDKMGKVLGAI